LLPALTVAGSKIFLSGFSGSASVLNGPQTVVTATATTITFNITTANFTQTPIAAGAQIYSYEYRNTIENVNYNNSTVGTHSHNGFGLLSSNRTDSHSTGHSITAVPSGNAISGSSLVPFIIMNYIMKI
jgi:hypothetical protein